MLPRRYKSLLSRGRPRAREVLTRVSFPQPTRCESTKVQRLVDWDIDIFRELAYNPCRPAVLPRTRTSVFKASEKWFLRDEEKTGDLLDEISESSELNPDFWEAHSQAIVPLEVTKCSHTNASVLAFERIEAPLGLFLQHMDASRSKTSQEQRIYLAQHDLRDLPKALQEDLPTPELVLRAGKGDLYSSSLWLGRPPTYTPLHRDPNPNLFVQLAGTKVVRLFSPEIGSAIYEFAIRSMQTRQATSQSAVFRGEEMMQGSERMILEELVWGVGMKGNSSMIESHVLQARLNTSEALFIPKGWWHSVKGVGTGVTASANWWFR